jgi:hypothetical protein
MTTGKPDVPGFVKLGDAANALLEKLKRDLEKKEAK